MTITITCCRRNNFQIWKMYIIIRHLVYTGISIPHHVLLFIRYSVFSNIINCNTWWWWWSLEWMNVFNVSCIFCNEKYTDQITNTINGNICRWSQIILPFSWLDDFESSSWSQLLLFCGMDTVVMSARVWIF